MKKTIVCLLLACAFSASALEIRVQPGQKGVFLYPVDARRGLSTAMIQSLAVIQQDGTAVTLQELRIELRSGDRVRQTTRYDASDLAKAAAAMSGLANAGALDLYDFIFQRSRLIGEKTRLAASNAVEPGSALMLHSIPLLVPRGADSMRIIAGGTDAAGAAVQASIDVPLRTYEQANEYTMPVRGAWLVAVGPSFSEAHRWAAVEEFALDLVRSGASGKTCGGACAKLTDFYAYGADVVAAADGVVVKTITDQKETSARLRKAGESADAFMQRTVAEQQKLLVSGAAGVAGNLVVIRHEGGEYSFYAHLAEGSVIVKTGEKVIRGQKLAKVGQTGNSTEPHLHFGIGDTPDPLYSRSLPVRFSGVTTPDGPQPPAFVQTGWIVEAK